MAYKPINAVIPIILTSSGVCFADFKANVFARLFARARQGLRSEKFVAVDGGIARIDARGELQPEEHGGEM